MYKTLQQQVKPGMLALLLFATVVLALLAGFLYVLKQPWQDIKKSRKVLSSLEREIKTERPLQDKITKLQHTVGDLDRQLNGAGPKLADSQMIAFVIGQLDNIADQHDVKLLSVEPGRAAKVFNFRELVFQVELEGNYFSLFQWLYQMEMELGPIVIKYFDIQANTARQRKMSLIIASYQYLEP